MHIPAKSHYSNKIISSNVINFQDEADSERECVPNLTTWTW